MPVIVRQVLTALPLDGRRHGPRQGRNQEKMVPRHYITADGFGITAAGRRYLQPLIGGEAYPPYRDGLPEYVTLRKVACARKLKTNFVI